MEEDSEIVDSNEIPNWNNKEQVKSYREIITSAIEKCRVEMSKEMVKGMEVLYKDKKTGQSFPIHIEDQRKVLINCIEALYILMKYNIDGDEKIKIKDRKIRIKNAYSKYYKIYISRETEWKQREWAEISKQIPATTIGTHIIQMMDDYILEQWKGILQQLLLLYKRKNEFSKKRTIGLYE